MNSTPNYDIDRAASHLDICGSDVSGSELEYPADVFCCRLAGWRNKKERRVRQTDCSSCVGSSAGIGVISAEIAFGFFPVAVIAPGGSTAAEAIGILCEN